jgi:tetratricopeptide (TPR) repeat protein
VIVSFALVKNRGTLTAAPQASPTERATDAYLRGKVLVGNENPSDNAAAIAALREATTLDPTLASAWAGLSRAYSIRAFYFAPDSEKGRLVRDAQFAVEKALSLEPENAEAHFARGLFLWTPGQRFPHEQAVIAYKRAISTDPKFSEARHQLALVYLHIGLFAAAKAQIDTAIMLDPSNSLARFRSGVIALYEGDYARARTVFNGTPLERSPSMWGFQMATAEFRLGHDSAATEIIDEYLGRYPRDEGGVGNSVRAMILAKSGRRPEAEASIATALRVGRNFGHFHHTAYNVASAYALLGDRDHAIQYLAMAADDGFPCYPLFANDSQLRALHKDPRYIALLARLEADWKDWKKRL